MSASDSSTLRFEELDSPPALDQSQTKQTSVVIDVPVAGKVLKIYTEQVTPVNGQPSLDVLLLHGMKFSSKDWVDIKAVYNIASWGYRVVAVDLPGYGKSSKDVTPSQEFNLEFMTSLVSVLGLHRPVIVSPSMSGSFSLPYLFIDGSSSTEKSRGFVPVTPICTENFIEQYKKSQLPTMHLCGTNDETPMATKGVEDLKNIPNNRFAPIEGAGHPCYLDNPDAFHKLLYFFLKQLV